MNSQPGGFGWRTALKIAWRDIRHSPGKFLFVILAVAVGVGALTGVRSFSRAFHSLLLGQARTLMAGDISVRVFALPDPAQTAALQSLETRGVRNTAVTETLTMANTAAVPDPVLVSVKAVDTSRYPFYGEVKLDPPGSLSHLLDGGSAAVSNDLLIRLKAHVGDQVRLGGQDFRIVALLASEPDRITGSLNVGPRVMISREGLARTGLIGVGSRAAQRFVFRLPPGGPDVQQVRNILKRAFPEGLIADYRETHPIITRGLDRSTTFLSMISLIALIVGALGVATCDARPPAAEDGFHRHSEVPGCAIGAGAENLPGAKRFRARPTRADSGHHLRTLGGARVSAADQPLLSDPEPRMGLDLVLLPLTRTADPGVLTTLLFTLPPLAGIRRIRPAVIFRREMAEARPDWLKRWSRSWEALATAGAILAGIGLMAAWLAGTTLRDSLKIGGYFAGGLLVSLLVVAGFAWILLRSLRALLRGPGRLLPAVVRQGAANLYRPGNHAQTILVTLGTGVMFTLTVYLVQHAMLSEMRESAPPGMANVFLLDIPGAQRQAVAELLKGQKGLEGQPEIIASVAVRLVSVNGVPVEKLGLQEWGRKGFLLPDPFR